MTVILDTDQNPFTGQSSLSLVRAQIDYRKNGSIEVGSFFATRVFAGEETIEGTWQSYNRGYLSLEDLISKAAIASNVTEAQAQAVIEGFVNMLWGLKTSIDNEVANPEIDEL
jgi:hypothetical protein